MSIRGLISRLNWILGKLTLRLGGVPNSPENAGEIKALGAAIKAAKDELAALLEIEKTKGAFDSSRIERFIDDRRAEIVAHGWDKKWQQKTDRPDGPDRIDDDDDDVAAQRRP